MMMRCCQTSVGVVLSLVAGCFDVFVDDVERRLLLLLLLMFFFLRANGYDCDGLCWGSCILLALPPVVRKALEVRQDVLYCVYR